jgi:large subunit ribosomal protein L6
MSRVGKKPIPLPAGVKAAISGNNIAIEGPKGKLSFILPEGITVEQEEGRLAISRSSDEPKQRSLHGMSRSLINNMVDGVTRGFERRLTINGIGYTAKVQGDTLALNVGFTHPVVKQIPENIKVECPSLTSIIVRGADKQKVGQFAAAVRAVRPPEPYNAKGIAYEDEQIRRKAGKAFGSVE